MITASAVSSTKDVVFGTSVLGSIYVNANKRNWKVFDSLLSQFIHR